MGLTHTGVLVAVGQVPGDRQEQTAADLLSDQAVHPPLDDRTFLDGEVDGGSAVGPRGVEGFVVAVLVRFPLDTGVLDDDLLAFLDLVAVPLDEVLGDELVGCLLVLGDGDLRFGVSVLGDGRHVLTKILGLLTRNDRTRTEAFHQVDDKDGGPLGHLLAHLLCLCTLLRGGFGHHVHGPAADRLTHQR